MWKAGSHFVDMHIVHVGPFGSGKHSTKHMVRPQAMRSPQHSPQASESPRFITMHCWAHVACFGFSTHICRHSSTAFWVAESSFSFVRSLGLLQAPAMP